MQLQFAALGALPALTAMWYFDRLDAKRPEPRSTLRLVAVMGALSVIPIGLIEYLLMRFAPPALDLYGQAAYQGFVVAAFTEELGKALCVLIFVYRRPEFDERMDGITYATRAGLGFALVENVLYLLGASSAQGFVVMFILRALLAIPLHAVCAAMMGYYLARRRFDRTGPGLVGGLFWAVLIHGAYDAAIFSVGPAHAEGNDALALGLLVVPLVCVVGGVMAVRNMSRTAHRLDDADPQVAAAHAALNARLQPAVQPVQPVQPGQPPFGQPPGGWGPPR